MKLQVGNIQENTKFQDYIVNTEADTHVKTQVECRCKIRVSNTKASQ